MDTIKKFLSQETASGFLLVISLILALIAENTSFKPFYDMLLETQMEFRIGQFQLEKPLLLWVNDALMAIFFFVVGLELKREILIGELSSPTKITLPAVAAIMGIVVPGIIYTAINYQDPIAMKGWAIPTATDIAFALGVLSLLGNRIPVGLKLLLLAIAIIDDIGAIMIITIFYTSDLSMPMLIASALALSILFILNKKNINKATPYLLVGLLLWAAVLKSGIHATLAGIMLAMFIPLKTSNPNQPNQKPLLKRLEHDLHATVAFVILPIFAFANAGISLTGLHVSDILHPIPLGITLGLVVGKQVGIFGSIWLMVKMRLATLPEAVTWCHIYGLSILCGIGFTMSLFIASLAFEQGHVGHIVNDRLGIIVGSLICAVLGILVLRFSKKNN